MCKNLLIPMTYFLLFSSKNDKESVENVIVKVHKLINLIILQGLKVAFLLRNLTKILYFAIISK